MLKVLKGINPEKITIQSLLSEGREALQYAGKIADVFKAAGWDVTPPTGMGSSTAPRIGIFIVSAKDEKEMRLNEFVAGVLVAGGLATSPIGLDADSKRPSGDVEIWVGSK
jgi:hypothetical protein